ncbi:hypothetical protein, partial [Pararhodobacter sp.]|uniref:hypothetical protein n=1 Tax=Pararhodobacter sp. TaxID=2127056 RepID=UPI002FDDADFE
LPTHKANPNDASNPLPTPVPIYPHTPMRCAPLWKGLRAMDDRQKDAGKEQHHAAPVNGSGREDGAFLSVISGGKYCTPDHDFLRRSTETRTVQNR